MPTYDYECDNCGHAFEEFAHVSQRHDVKCVCGAKASMAYNTPPVGRVGDDWGAENNGKGREITQLNTGPFEKDKVYMSSRNNLEEHCRKLQDKGEIGSFQRA